MHLSEINAAVLKDPEEYIRECDFGLKHKIRDVAGLIEKSLDRSHIVLLSGPTGSGKTTSAAMIQEELIARGIMSYVVSLDDYFEDVSLESTPRTDEGAFDFESPDCLDLELLGEHFSALSEGREVLVPSFDFVTQKRRANYGRQICLRENEVVIFEGIHALGPKVAGQHEKAVKVFVNVASEIFTDGGEVCFMASRMRLLRRLVRDNLFRGAPAEYTLELWDNVRRSERSYVIPAAENADISVDSALGYEVSVMKMEALPVLEAVPPKANRYAQIEEMIRTFELFSPVEPGLVPPKSLLREFIGGSSYYL